MSTIKTIQPTDLITGSRTDINNNFANLNNDKVETSVIDTDTTLAANSDAKIPSQKAIRAFVEALSVFSIQTLTASAVTLPVTTNGNQRVIVWAKGTTTGTGGTTGTVSLNYDGVQKDKISISNENYTRSFALMYTEIPPAGTKNITIGYTGSFQIDNPKIIVQLSNV